MCENTLGKFAAYWGDSADVKKCFHMRRCMQGMNSSIGASSIPAALIIETGLPSSGKIK